MNKNAAMLAADVLTLARKRATAGFAPADIQRPFRFFLCGDPALVAEFRGLLLSGHPDGCVPLDAAATLETLDPLRGRPASPDARAIILLCRPGDRAGARVDLLEAARLPVFVVTVDPFGTPAFPALAPIAGSTGDYTVVDLSAAALRQRVFPHLVERCKGAEIAVGRRLPVLRETVAARLTRNAASSALKIAAASAVVDHVPLLGVVLGAMASAGDMVAITGIQIALMMQIGAVYGKDHDVHRVWEMLPIVGGGFGWRMLSRELAGFVPVAGIAIKGAIAYAGTIVVGEGVAFYYEQGRHMSNQQATTLYDDTKRAAMGFARELYSRFSRRP